MEGYFDTKNDGNGKLNISITNMPEFRKLLSQAEKEARQLNNTISELRNFELSIEFDVKSPISE